MAILIMPAHEAGDRRGTVLAWHKRVGDWVEKGDKLFTYSMESGVYLAVCEQAGRLAAIYLPAGESAPCPADAALLAAPSAAGALRFAQLDDVRQAETAPLEEEAPSEEAPLPEEAETAPFEEEAPAVEETPSPEDAAETAPLEEETSSAEETPQEPDEVPAEGSALSVSQREPAEEETDAEETEKPKETAPAPETPAGPGGFVCFERFHTAAFRRLAEAFRLTRPALKGAPIDEKALLLCLCLRTDASALGLEAYAELGLQDVADFLAEGLLEAENVQLSSLLAAVPARCPGLTLGRLDEEAVLCLRARSREEAERFLPALRAALEAPDRLI